ncbi:MAG TPA: metal-sulfur cluster assembly factor [Candidatus Acetothermia bacterium]|mgnify:FL=1|nr:metal-sulfur cluster assembly factor [Candidatus Acetothermia bacterium]
MEATSDAVREVLRERVIDPELGINIVDLGLIYDVEISGGQISVDMTLTTPGCPLAGTLAAQVEEVLRQAFPGFDVEVSLVWEPRWTPELMSEEARRHFGAL